MSLFPIPQRVRHLVEFNAGKCIRDGDQLKPDLRKGVIFMDQGDDQLLHFYWKERVGNTTEEDLIIFPEEAEMKRVPECTTGRVYRLHFKSSNQRLFFWMQDKDDSKDEERVAKLNRLINDTQSVLEEQRRNAGADMEEESESAADMLNLLSGGQDLGINQEQFLQFLQTAGGLGGTIPNTSPIGGDGPPNQSVIASAPSSRRGSGQSDSEQQQSAETVPENEGSQLSTNQLHDLRNILSEIRVPQGTDRTNSLELGNVLTPEAIRSILSDQDIASALFPHLPETSDNTNEELQEIIHSPQFRQSLHRLSAALQSGQLGPLMTQLGLDPSAGNGVEAFLAAIEEQARRRDDQDRDSMDQD
ncbi:hypothetical protein INT44_002159 [Umbelopsis vinacea]|uniref:Regulatory particle non-ATPase 13 n=1 Tax=Umbelopsis vinacea TaxID=44442 RepID=A0A8H7Q4Y6_9FUNG|nr:hypothetical protein INT44_002159 [Umbelopsis vinacea]